MHGEDPMRVVLKSWSSRRLLLVFGVRVHLRHTSPVILGY